MEKGDTRQPSGGSRSPCEALGHIPSYTKGIGRIMGTTNRVVHEIPFCTTATKGAQTTMCRAEKQETQGSAARNLTRRKLRNPRVLLAKLCLDLRNPMVLPIFFGFLFADLTVHSLTDMGLLEQPNSVNILAEMGRKHAGHANALFSRRGRHGICCPSTLDCDTRPAEHRQKIENTCLKWQRRKMQHARNAYCRHCYLRQQTLLLLQLGFGVSDAVDEESNTALGDDV